MLAEAQAEGHEIRPHFIKKIKPDLSESADSSQTNEFVPDYMLVENGQYANGDLYGSGESSSSDSTSGAKADVIYIAPGNERFRKNGFKPPREFIMPTIASKKKTKIMPDWIPNASSSGLTSIYEPDQHIMHTQKKFKARKPKRLNVMPTLASMETHISALQRKPTSLPNFTKIKNRLHATSSLNTSI